MIERILVETGLLAGVSCELAFVKLAGLAMDVSVSVQAKHNATAISRTKKLNHLSSLSEDDFRDKVIRPVYLRKGLTDGRELCGPDEEGKDCIFVEKGKIKQIIWAVQTKKGSLNMGKLPKQNVAEAIAQLRLAVQRGFSGVP